MLRPSIFGENLFDDFFSFGWNSDKVRNDIEKKLYGRNATNLMKTDIKETDRDYEVEIDLPGFSKEDVNASLENGYLIVRASKNYSNEDKQENGKYIRQERYAGTCQRSFYVGEAVTHEDIKGEFKHGVLKLNVPKKTQTPAVEEKKYIAIEG